jgi:hypothetical protein
MSIIIISGDSGTGKTSLATKLIRDLRCTAFLKDDYKENIYDNYAKVPNLIKWALYRATQEAISANRTILIEGNFQPSQKRVLKKILANNATVIEVFCLARGLVSFKRFVARNRSGNRHRGHRDRLWYSLVFGSAALSAIGVSVYKPLRLSSNVLALDTTDFSQVNYAKVLAFIQKRI